MEHRSENAVERCEKPTSRARKSSASPLSSSDHAEKYTEKKSHERHGGGTLRHGHRSSRQATYSGDKYYGNFRSSGSGGEYNDGSDRERDRDRKQKHRQVIVPEPEIDGADELDSDDNDDFSDDHYVESVINEINEHFEGDDEEEEEYHTEEIDGMDEIDDISGYDAYTNNETHGNLYECNDDPTINPDRMLAESDSEADSEDYTFQQDRIQSTTSQWKETKTENTSRYRGDASVVSRGLRGNSPERNPELHPVNADVAGGVGADVTSSELVVAQPQTSVHESQQSQDPPDLHELMDTKKSSPYKHHKSNSSKSMDPDQQINPTILKHLEIDSPPTPVSAERNRRRPKVDVYNSESAKGGGAEGREKGKGGQYTNYALDDEAYRQYQNQIDNDEQQSGIIIPTPPLASSSNYPPDAPSVRSARGQDPPEGGRGGDPKPWGSSDPPTGSSHRVAYRSGLGGISSSAESRRVKRDDAPAAKGVTTTAAAASTKSMATKKDPEKKKPVIKGILKKKNSSPPPIAFFGKPVASPPQPPDNFFDNQSANSIGSDPSVSEQKHSVKIQNFDDDGNFDSQSVSNKSGLRSGRFAAANAAAAAAHNPGPRVVEESDDSGSDAVVDADISEDERKHSPPEPDDDENTLTAITQNNNDKFDRTRSHFLRTADLGLTQDTIFAEQFLDDPNAKPEPHYHHPSLHPPPGVQFHFDENWICVDDGRGGHSPIAPQAVDALVAMGYRAACDPMMWTPTAKTRKYMTEKNLRFDDIPIPGPLEEGEGKAGDSSCLCWSGKFSHKYHGHEIPATRSQGIINMSAEDLVDLLMDSTRVKEYNKTSKGRSDELVLSDGTNLETCPFSGRRKKKLTGVVMEGSIVVDGVAVLESETDGSDVEQEEEHVFDDSGNRTVRTLSSRVSNSTAGKGRKTSKFEGVTKIVRTKNKPPLVRKLLEFVTLLHCRALSDEQGGDGYIIAGRGITPAEDAEKDTKGVRRSEILINVYIIRRLNTKKKSEEKKKNGSKSIVVSASGKKSSREELKNRCLMICVNHLKSPMIPNMLAKKVGLSASVNFISDIRQLTA